MQRQIIVVSGPATLCLSFLIWKNGICYHASLKELQKTKRMSTCKAHRMASKEPCHADHHSAHCVHTTDTIVLLKNRTLQPAVMVP